MNVRSLWNWIFKRKQKDEDKEKAEYEKALCTLFSKVMQAVLHDDNFSNDLAQYISVKDILQNVKVGGSWSMDVTFQAIILKFFDCRMNDTQKVIELNKFSSDELIAQIKLQIKKLKIEDKKKAIEKDFK